MTDKKFTITNQQFYERYKEDYDSHNGGAWLILMERIRHYEVEGWDGEHDQDHNHGELAIAAACYAVNGTDAGCHLGAEDAWPWDESWDKRNKHDRIKQLVIAGSLIAAEIDRLQGNKERYDGADLKQWADRQSPSGANVLVERLESLLRSWKEDIDFKKQAEEKAKNRQNVGAEKMWRHKREGIEKAVRELSKSLTQYKSQPGSLHGGLEPINFLELARKEGLRWSELNSKWFIKGTFEYRTEEQLYELFKQEACASEHKSDREPEGMPEHKMATNIPDGENDWVVGAETFSRRQVFRLLSTQRAMILNDIKRVYDITKLPEDVQLILENPRTPKI